MRINCISIRTIAFVGGNFFFAVLTHRLDSRKDGDHMKKTRVRVFLLHRRVLAVLCTLAVAAGIFYVTLYPTAHTAAATTRQLPIYSVERKEKLCSISFDAAWGEGKVRQFTC